MIRTIDEMDLEDALVSTVSVSDTLAFCIVASDYMRARRRRFPLATQDANVHDLYDDTTAFFDKPEYVNIPTYFGWKAGRVVTFVYGTFKNESFYLFNSSKEYLEND